MALPLLRYLPLLLLALAWETASYLHLVSSLVLPPLTSVAEAWLDLIRDGELFPNAMASLYRGAMGLGLSIVFGSMLGIFMAWWRPLTVVAPLVEMFYPMPKSALIPVTVIWLGSRCLEGSVDLSWLHAAGHDRRVQWCAAASRRWSGLPEGWAPAGWVCCGTCGAKRDAGAAQWHPHRARAFLHLAREFRNDRGPGRLGHLIGVLAPTAPMRGCSRWC